jgi:hypothetical protein
MVRRAKQKHRAVGSPLPGIAVINMHPQQRETMFSMGSVQMSYLKDERRYE